MCNNSSEDNSLENLLSMKTLGQPLSTLQDKHLNNGKVKRSFATLYGRMSTMMLTAVMDLGQKAKLCVSWERQ
jgi:hypothetical protein